MKIFNYILTISLILLTTTSFGQKEEKKKMPKRTDNYIHMPGLRLGVDITRPIQNLWTKGNRYGTEVSADFELKPNLYIAAELGWEKMKMIHDYIDYESSGSYIRLGADYNILGTDGPDDRDMFYLGFRYATGVASQQVNKYVISQYWTDEDGSFGKQSFNSHWMEVLVGLKAEIFNNFYMGWAIRTKIMLYKKDFDIPPIYFTPGFGKSEGTVTLDFTYAVYYTIPFRFRKSQAESAQ